MALFKILKGQQARLPNTSKQGYAYYTTDKGKFYIFNSETQRRTLNPDIKITIGNQTKTSTTLSPEVAFDLASIGAAAAGHNHDNRYLKLSGGTMTGTITLLGNQYADSYSGALNANNSNIYGVNSIYTANLADTSAEGIHFYRTSTTVDSLWIKNGVIYFTPNRTLGKTGIDYTIIHSGNYTDYTVKKDGTGATGNWNININKNAATATKLQTPRSLWGNSFDGSSDISGNITLKDGDQLNMQGEGDGFAFNYWDGKTTPQSTRFYDGQANQIVRFASNGNVGIGTSNPTSKLQINGDSLFQGETVTRIVRPEETKKYSLGTSSWYFKEAFIDTVNGTNLYLRGQTANRLIWLNGSKMLDTTGHYASGSKIAVNSTEEPGYNFYVNGNSYFTGTIRAKTASSSWIDGQKGTDRSALLVTDATDSDSYWPWISHHNISSKRYFSLGQLANSIYLIGTTDARTTNGYDYGWQFDFSNGVMTVPGNIQPVSTNTQTLGTFSLRWAKVYIGTADTYGSTTKGVYWNAGVPTAMTYELKSTVNDGTATRIAYYSGTNAVSSGSIITDGSYLRNIGGYNNSSYSLSAESAIINNYLNIAGISSSPTRYKLYVVGQSWISGTLWNQHLYPEATKTYDLGSTSYIWNNIYGNQLWLYNLQEGNSDVTDNTEILTSYASNDGFADSNAVGKVYKRDAIHLYNYIISKTDNFYVKKAGDTMTGNLSFASIGDIATSAKISWSGSTDGADIYYQTTAADQGNLVLNTRDDANCYIRFAYNGAFKSYIRTSDGTYIGKLLGISDGTSWINGQRYEKGGFNLSDATNTTDYWPWLRQTNTSSARWFSFGTLGNCFYMIGSSTGRTDNGYDHGLCYDISNGSLSGINDIYTSSIYASNWFRSQGNSGWYSQNYGGGWVMTDSTWIRSFNDKSLYTGTGTIRSEREIQSTSIEGVCQFRAIGGAYGAMLRNDGADTYILLTNAWDQYGYWNGLRPFRINNGSGIVYIQTSLIYQHFTSVGNLYIGWNEGSSPALTASYGGTTASGSGNVITEARMKAAIANKHGSDKRVKQNIRDLSIQTIKKIYMNFKPVRYEFKQGALADKYAPGERFGYIAQDMESSFLKYGVNPGQLVYHQHNIDKTSKLYSYLGECNLYTIDYENLHALHTLMIQQHDSQIEQLKKQNKKLQQQIQLLNAKLDTLVVSHL